MTFNFVQKTLNPSTIKPISFGSASHKKDKIHQLLYAFAYFPLRCIFKNSISIRNHTQSQTQCSTAANKTPEQIAGGHKYYRARCLQFQHHKQERRLKELRAFQFVPPAAKKPHGIVVCCTLYPLTHILALCARLCVCVCVFMRARAEVNLFRIIICLRGLSAVRCEGLAERERRVNFAYLLWMRAGWLDGGGRTHKRVIRIARLHRKCHQVGVYLCLPAHDPISGAYADFRIFAAALCRCDGETTTSDISPDTKTIARRISPAELQEHTQNIQCISGLTFNLITCFFRSVLCFNFFRSLII